MSTEIEKNVIKILNFLYKNTTENKEWFYGPDIQAGTGLEPIKINDAVTLLREKNFVEWELSLGTAPFKFDFIWITPRGKYEVQREQAIDEVTERIPTKFEKEVKLNEIVGQTNNDLLNEFLLEFKKIKEIKPPTPVGSPYGFNEEDWEIVSLNRADKKNLYVVLGSKFESPNFNTDNLRENVKLMFQRVIDKYNLKNPNNTISLKFICLGAGYGEHLFNQIARDIISSDIAVFETSDLAPNIFLEIGVALTWGSRVFPIKKVDCPRPPSDISGHTYADYVDDASKFLDPIHDERLLIMVERAIRRKG